MAGGPCSVSWASRPNRSRTTGSVRSIPMKLTILSTLLALTLGTTGCGHVTKKNYQPPAAAEPAIAADPSKPNSPANTPEIIETNDIIAQITRWKLGPVDIQNDLDGGV